MYEATTQRHSRVSWLLAWAAFLPVALLRAGVLAESDTFWQIRAGQRMLETHSLPTVDTFSWTAANEPWQAHSWGFDVLLAACYNLAGLPAVALFCAALAALAAGAVLLLMRSVGIMPLRAAITLVGASPLVIAWLSARPQTIDYIATPLLVLLLARLPKSARPSRVIAVIGVLMASWVNLHEASLLGLAIIGALAALQLCRRETHLFGIRTVIAGIVGVIASLCNPWGIDVLTRASNVASASAPLITEWQHPNLADPGTMLALLIGVLGLWRAVLYRQPEFIAALAVTFIGTLIAVRILPILLLLALPMLAAGSYPRLTEYVRSRRVIFVPGLILAELAFVFAAVPSLSHIGQPDPQVYSPGVVAQIPAGCKVFNSYLVGGYIILVRPDVRVSIDSRNDLYGVELMTTNLRTINGQRAPGHALEGADCALLSPRSALATALSHDPQWREAAADAVAVLYVRR